MPKYIKFNTADSYAPYGNIEKVNIYVELESCFGIFYTSKGSWWGKNVIPATETEYNEYIKQSTQ